ncbi:UPF0052-domain-containing protein [Basidiobolus meristosporus CBS 931.73]|uniref:UPF0052-domain-containing protein n=1 Tax=Basidiobolus meristosporus CBS 931.73 TaxID=1314790 RepID=A0A1Y1YS04_9FUNG|nr:UPF0052-domain-containing protein [Basidiobolus meristosporus CBS 931.73]|eukprot:ORY00345.1 UPF0052-domain-containing protein [Basidiobolus meristosporus CBS 931.73]
MSVSSVNGSTKTRSNRSASPTPCCHKPSTRSIFVFSGGSACNSLCQILQSITINISYILGVSDNGGSTSEILRVTGGPSIGDLRSRLTRLINTEDGDAETIAERIVIKELLSYRLPADGEEASIRHEWTQIVEGTHRLWSEISVEKKETIRGFLTLFHFEILKRAHKRFDYRNGSIGNFFLTGARLFFNSLEAAIFLFAAITGISEPTTVIPMISTNHMVTIAALLEDESTIVGQCEISHPSVQQRTGDAYVAEANGDHVLAKVNSNIIFDKHDCGKLPARIKRIYYINEYGQEIFPKANPKCIQLLSRKHTLLYSIGSLYTSIMPCLVLRGVGNAIAYSTSLRNKILMLNGTVDRETEGYTAIDFLQAIVDGLNFSRQVDASAAHAECKSPSVLAEQALTFPVSPCIDSEPASKFITHLIYLDNSQIPVDPEAIQRLGIATIKVSGSPDAQGNPTYEQDELWEILDELVQ